MKKTQLDLYESSHAAAFETLDKKEGFEVESAALEIFKAGGNKAADWDFWSRNFRDRRIYFLRLRELPAPSEALLAAGATEGTI